MIVTVFYDGKEDDVFENVTHVDTYVKEMEEKVLRIHFWDGGARRTQLIYMDADTEVRLTFQHKCLSGLAERP